MIWGPCWAHFPAKINIFLDPVTGNGSPLRPPEVSKMSYSSMTRNRSAKKNAAGDRWGPLGTGKWLQKEIIFRLKFIFVAKKIRKSYFAFAHSFCNCVFLFFVGLGTLFCQKQERESMRFVNNVGPSS